MSARSPFMRVWKEWRRLQPPVDNFRHGRRSAATYGLECDLDHIASSVTSLGNAFMSQKDWDYVKRGIQELQELEAVRSEAQSLKTVEPQHRSALLQYVIATEGVLRAIVAAEDPSTDVGRK